MPSLPSLSSLAAAEHRRKGILNCVHFQHCIRQVGQNCFIGSSGNLLCATIISSHFFIKINRKQNWQNQYARQKLSITVKRRTRCRFYREKTERNIFYMPFSHPSNSNETSEWLLRTFRKRGGKGERIRKLSKWK